MSRLAIATLAALAAFAPGALGAPGLAGRIEGNVYHAANGTYEMDVPVLPELGGVVSDTENVVTFEDNFSTHVSVAAFPQDAAQRWQLTTRGLKDYLGYFFTEFVLREFKAAYKDASVEPGGGYAPKLLGGALFAYVLLPGGSMFANRIPVVTPDWKPPVAKRGNLLFVRNGCIFVISMELAERAVEGSAYHRTVAEEDALLHARLVAIAGRIRINPNVALPADSRK